MEGAEYGGAQRQAELDSLRGDLARQRQEADRLTQAVDQFVANLAHDLKNPLGAMRVSVQALKRSLQKGKVLEPAQIVERLERLEVSIDQALGLIAEGRAKLDGAAIGQPTGQRQPVDLAALVQQQIDQLKPAVGERRIRLDPLCPELIGHWDFARVTRAVRELLDNALKFSPRGQCVRVLVRHDSAQNMAEVCVIDLGVGIPTKDLEHVGERFYRADNVMGRFKGVGLGLFEAMRCATDHNGSIVVESEEGRGSRVTLRLPCN
jgi:signal transduction histidine kinase